jgi:hypothetical protein
MPTSTNLRNLQAEAGGLAMTGILGLLGIEEPEKLEEKTNTSLLPDCSNHVAEFLS